MTTQDMQIPEDVLDAAKDIAEQPWLTRAERDRMTMQIAKAILAERQRCADVATDYGREHGKKVEWDLEGSLIEACADRIAEIISSPKCGEA